MNTDKTEDEYYFSVSDYDPVLRSHCRLDLECVVFPSLPAAASTPLRLD